MTETALPLLLAFLAGAALGAAYFALLWRSVRALGAAGWTRFAAGAAARAALVLAALGAALAAGRGAEEIAVAGLGFLAARFAATRAARRGAPEG